MSDSNGTDLPALHDRAYVRHQHRRQLLAGFSVELVVPELFPHAEEAFRSVAKAGHATQHIDALILRTSNRESGNVQFAILASSGAWLDVVAMSRRLAAGGREPGVRAAPSRSRHRLQTFWTTELGRWVFKCFFEGPRSPGSEARTRMPAGSCGDACPKAPTCLCTARRNSMPCHAMARRLHMRPRQTLTLKHRPNVSVNVLHRPAESATHCGHRSFKAARLHCGHGRTVMTSSNPADDVTYFVVVEGLVVAKSYADGE